MKHPTRFDEYFLVERVAVGGMAEVFKGVTYSEEGFERHMAVKRILPHIAEDNEFIEMFIDEAKLVSQLQHPNIPQVYHLGQCEGHYFISMEFISGQDLRSIFDRARSKEIKIDLGICAYIVMEVCEALDYAHRKTNSRMEPLNLIHRDVSPQNILVSYDGTIKLVDFGIAKATGQINQTQAGILKGKFSYMSPEQARGYPIDARSDLFGLGAVLYEMSTLERCFLGQSDFSTIERVRNTEYKQPRQIRRDIPTQFERIIRKSLAKDPNARFQSAADFQEALRTFIRANQLQRTRAQVQAFMSQFFPKEIEGEQLRIEQFRTYAAEHIPEAQRHGDSRRFKRLSREELQVEYSRPRFALGDEIKLSLDQDIKRPQAPPPVKAHQSSASSRRREQRVPSKARNPALRHMKRALQLILLALLTGSVTAAITWVRRPLQGAILLEDYLSLNLPYELTGEGISVRGRLPVLVDRLPAGLYQLSLTLPDQTIHQRQLNLTAGETTQLRLDELTLNGRGVVRLTSEPSGVSVTFDGQAIGVTPLEALLPSKELKITLSAAGYRSRTIQLTPKSQEVMETHLNLPPSEVEWQLMSEVDNARFELVKEGETSGRFLGLGQVNVKLLNDTVHHVYVSASGYKPLTVTLPTSAHPRAKRLITLQIKPTTSAQKSEELPNIPIADISDRSTQSAPELSSAPTSPTSAANPSSQRSSGIIELTPTASRSESVDRQSSPQTTSTSPPKQKKTQQKTSSEESKPRPKPTRRSARTTQPNPQESAQPGFLKLISFPPAEVFINGRRIGWTPLINHKLPEGQHQLTLRFQSGEERVISQVISAGRISLRRVKK